MAKVQEWKEIMQRPKGGIALNIEEKHKQLYKKIPEFQCKPGCTDCCGVVPFSCWEWEQIRDKRKADITLKCPYAVNGKCEIYDQRPLICRLFGTVDTALLRCPHGCRPERLLTEEEAHKIMGEYHKLMIESALSMIESALRR